MSLPLHYLRFPVSVIVAKACPGSIHCHLYRYLAKVHLTRPTYKEILAHKVGFTPQHKQATPRYPKTHRRGQTNQAMHRPPDLQSLVVVTEQSKLLTAPTVGLSVLQLNHAYLVRPLTEIIPHPRKKRPIQSTDLIHLVILPLNTCYLSYPSALHSRLFPLSCRPLISPPSLPPPHPDESILISITPRLHPFRNSPPRVLQAICPCISIPSTHPTLSSIISSPSPTTSTI